MSVTYYFECRVCKKKSKPLREQYARLRPGTYWLCDKDKEEALEKNEIVVVIAPVADGAICKDTDF